MPHLVPLDTERISCVFRVVIPIPLHDYSESI